MEASSTQTLRSAENLSLPKVQVVVMTANMSCSHCKMRISRVVSKMNKGLIDYTVDMTKKEVTMRGVIDTKKGGTRQTKKKRSLSLFGLECFGAT
ncbi:hypothetical protein ZIOFF_019748 [Zingiber officinale]|uniref:HMA domain-containing protein n=1 Tax=Zingiber officinale TaxID=94328 RepID=A0A8J5HG79_ZINOF|nr:hypothetical protein ZIOFF_023187 [Zingiber officinale]KAG6522604.1 hypothetical protein ZIOFF_019748 [Zingiber officinale]